MKENFLDKTISFFSPSSGAKRLRSRINENKLRSYDGASKGRRTAGWGPGNASAESEVAIALPELRNKSRDLFRNNPHGKAALNEHVNSIVGEGIQVRFHHKSKSKEKKFNTHWKLWSKNCDFDEKVKFSGAQSLICKGERQSGDCIVRFRYTTDKVPFRLQILESDFIAEHLTKVIDGGEIRRGIEYDSQGRVSAYHLYSMHPGGQLLKHDLTTHRIPKEEILHPFDIERPGQQRGVPFIAPAVIRLKDIDDFENAEMVRQKISSCFTAFVTHPTSEDSLTGVNPGEFGERLEPGLIEELPSGSDIKFSNPDTKEGYGPYIKNALHSVATGASVSYEGMTGDFSDVNFSSAKMADRKFLKAVKIYVKNIMIDQVLEPVTDKFLELSPLFGLNSDGVTVSFVAPKTEMIDPVKETAAMIAQIRGGLKSLSQGMQELGLDPETQFDKIKSDNDIIDKLKLKLDSDARHISKNGNLQTLDEETDEPKET